MHAKVGDPVVATREGPVNPVTTPGLGFKVL